MRGRRRSPPPGHPPPGAFRRDDRRYPTAPRERRRRSITPDRFRRGGSPPPFKRGRYGREPEPHYPSRGYDNRFYGRPSPPPRDSRRDGPRPYKDFCRTLPDDVTPEEAQREYQQYLAEYWGSEVRAEFESKRNEDWMKRRFDPRGMRKAMEERNEEAQKSATAFAEDVKAGLLDPKSDDFNQGAGAPITNEEAENAEDADEDEAKDAAKEEKKADVATVITAPEVSWKEEKIHSDLSLSRQLISKLDQEKGIKSNDLISEDGIHNDSSGEQKTPAENGKAANDEQEPAKPSQKGNAEEDIAKLDLQLTYLWRVHAVDYYAGKEHADPQQYELRTSTSRTLRGPKPEEGEQTPEAEEKKGLKLAEKKIDQVWKKRIVSGDPFEAALQKEKAEKLLDDWVEDQVKQIDENKWGCKLSQKLFVGKDYVIKHVRLKHTEKLEAQQAKIFEDLYFENYKKFREDEQKAMEAEMAKMQQAMQNNLPMPWDGSAPAQGAPEGFAGGFANPGFPGVNPQARGPLMPQQGPAMMMPRTMMPPPGQMLVLAPGAGPMGPFISVPISEGGIGGRGMGRGPPLRGPSGGRSGRGFFQPFMGGPMPGSKPDPRGVREYYDLDNPSNNRAVLDYGDL